MLLQLRQRRDRSPATSFGAHGGLAGYAVVATAKDTKPQPRKILMVVRIAEYAFLVPFIEDDDHSFLKTIIPSRKATRDFIERGAGS